MGERGWEPEAVRGAHRLELLQVGLWAVEPRRVVGGRRACSGGRKSR